MLEKYELKINQSEMVGSEAKNPLPTISGMSWTDIAGLSWIFTRSDPEDYG